MPNCSPPNYPGSPPYTPTFVESSVSCAMSTHQELRGRAPVGIGGTFFRTKGIGASQNDLSIELVYDGGDDLFTLFVRDNGAIVETFDPGSGSPLFVGRLTGQSPPDGDGNCTPNNLIPTLRSIVNAESNYIEMPTTDYGGEASGAPIFEAIDDDAGCLSPFSEVGFAGGESGPTSGPPISGAPPETQPRSGPERTMYVISLTEFINGTVADTGLSVNPPLADKIKQWDGFNWIPYEPNVCL